MLQADPPVWNKPLLTDGFRQRRIFEPVNIISFNKTQERDAQCNMSMCGNAIIYSFRIALRWTMARAGTRQERTVFRAMGCKRN